VLIPDYSQVPVIIRVKMKGISPNIDFSFDLHDLDLKRVK
jgi:hypothetical protein